MRYTDRDCYAAMIRVVAALRAHRFDLGVSLPTNPKWVTKLEELAGALEVPVRRWGSPECDDGPRLVLDYAPSCYGGGVRPAICEAGKTGEHTPRWWVPSAGLGPGAKPRREFCEILGAVEHSLELVLDAEAADASAS